MAFHIERPQKLDPNKKVYFAGGKRWTDDYSQRQTYTTQAKARAVTEASSEVITGTRVGAGFIGASIVSE